MERFYVYTISHPITCVPFYVGKGQGKRAQQHMRDFEAGRVSNQAKHDAIGRIVALGLRPAVEIVERYSDEADAFAHEIELIASLPDLTNIRAGGEGLSLSADEIKRRQQERQKRLWPPERIAHEKARIRRIFTTQPGEIDRRRRIGRLHADIIAVAEQWCFS